MRIPRRRPGRGRGVPTIPGNVWEGTPRNLWGWLGVTARGQLIRRLVQMARQRRPGVPRSLRPPPERHGPAPAVILPWAGLNQRQELLLIIALAVCVRCVGFDAPYTSQHWIKQLQIAPIARNFATRSLNILAPRTDYTPGGPQDMPPYIEIEFQLVTWLTAVLYKVMGITRVAGHEWVGRLVTVSFSLGSMVLLYRLMLMVLGVGPATYGLLFFAFAPSNWYLSRCLMSEPLMIFFSIAVVYFFARWLSTGLVKHFLLAALCGALCFLVKLPTVLLFLPLAYLASQRFGRRVFLQPAVWGIIALWLLPALGYYAYSHHTIGGRCFTVGVGFGGGMWFSPRDFLRPGNYSLILMRLVRDHLTPLGLVLLPLGVLMVEDGRWRANLFHVWLAGVLIYFVVVSGGNIRQNYYQVPLLPPAAAFVGLAWEQIVASRRYVARLNAVLVPLFLAMCVWGVQPMFQEYKAIRAAAQDLDLLDDGGAPVIIFPPGYGCLTYFDRPGWVGREGMGKPSRQVAAVDVPGPEYVEARIKRSPGARWAVCFTPGDLTAKPALHDYLRSKYLAAETVPQYTIFDLSKPAAAGPASPRRAAAPPPPALPPPEQTEAGSAGAD